MPKIIKWCLWSVCMSCVLSQHARAAILADLEVTTRNVFNSSVTQRSFVASFLNRINWTTREDVIVRQFWLRPGEEVLPEDAAEFERKLRAMDIFADVRVSLRPVSSTSERVILVVETQDRTSIKFGGSGSFLGGVGTVGFTASERSLAGQGNIVTLGYTQNTDDESRLAFSYEDIHFFRDDMQGAVRFGETEDGEFTGFTIESPFQYRADNFSWELKFDDEDKAVNFFAAGDVVAIAPLADQNIVFTTTWRSGSRKNRWLQGLVLRNDTRKYFDATGPQAAAVNVPVDFDRVFAGYLVGYDQERSYQTLQGLDTVILPQDISLGYSHQLLTGLSRREQGESTDQPEIFYQFRSRHKWGQSNYLSVDLEGNARLLDGESQQRKVSFSVKGYMLGHIRHKLAARLTYDTNAVRDGLDIESRLGESDGLRGYENDSFSGAKRLRLNIEDRILTGWHYATVHVGLLAFFDAGWVANNGESFSDPYRSAGIGLRIGSRQLLGKNLIRVDLSFPLDNNYDDSPLLSIATGQLFSF